MKANRKQTAVKLTTGKIDTHVMVRVVTKYGKYCLHQVVTSLKTELASKRLCHDNHVFSLTEFSSDTHSKWPAIGTVLNSPD